jgi:hypothetical protein
MDHDQLSSINDSINIVGISSFINADGSTDIREIERSIVEQEESKTVQESNEDYVAEFQKRITAMESAVGISLTDSTDGPLLRHSLSSDDDDDKDKDNSGNAPSMGGGHSARFDNVQPIHNDPDLVHMSNEQMKQRVLQNALNSINTTPMTGEEKFSLDAEKLSDKKNMLLEQINMLRTNLEDEGVKISDVQLVTTNNTFEEVESVYKQLRYRNDHARYCGFANEFAQMGAYGLEWAFDGDKRYFGIKPDLTGWGATLNIKMRRLSYETSSLVSEGMRSYNMGNFSRLCLELIPSMVLHSKMRKNKIGTSKNRPSDAEVGSAMNNLRRHDDLDDD